MSLHFAVAGWFSQDGTRINFSTEGGVTLYEAEGQYPFSGFLTVEDGEGSRITGFLTDRCGKAFITGTWNAAGRGTKLHFQKRYLDRDDEIDYDLTLLPEPVLNFRGHYKGKSVGKGDAHLSLFTLPASFFQ